jgi:hypothetical protein
MKLHSKHPRSFTVTSHAVIRYTERFSTNITPVRARKRLENLVSHAKFMRVLPGKARLYAISDVRFVVKDGCVLTVYPPSSMPATITDSNVESTPGVRDLEWLQYQEALEDEAWGQNRAFTISDFPAGQSGDCCPVHPHVVATAKPTSDLAVADSPGQIRPVQARVACT